LDPHLRLGGKDHGYFTFAEVKHGLKVTQIHQVVEYTPATCFQKFAEQVSEARRVGEIHYVSFFGVGCHVISDIVSGYFDVFNRSGASRQTWTSNHQGREDRLPKYQTASHQRTQDKIQYIKDQGYNVV
jgi:hypothetical protein